ncbi:transcriptional regulator PpsR [Jiella marina]|uniref:transcriptional regulator PpsR n=1 Tax=Jiella sp. LLJ827 TaxID=2917712 RepID=UPI0021016704|nr:transcriptional regulator PpsR [Jiella sp. LLJ827]MCQ0986371.1 transcriptional regulator PpsR [Jiella sp. LLJ827]
MEHPSAGRHFSDPSRSFANLEAALVASMVTASTDIALLLDQSGIVEDVAVRESDLFGDVEKGWIGQHFTDIVTTESRYKVERLLAEDPKGDSPTRREINHPMPGGPDLPISYSILPLTKNGMRLALGRDLRIMASLQQDLVETQLALESDYARLRTTAAQYRVLFDTAAESMLILDADTSNILEANSRARERFERNGTKLVGQSVGTLFAAQARQELDRLLAEARTSGEPKGARFPLAEGNDEVAVSVRFYRQHGAIRYAIRFIEEMAATTNGHLVDLVARIGHALPDAIVVVDPDFTITSANESFLDLSEIATKHQAVGRSLTDLLGRRGVELGFLKKAIDTNGQVRNFSTVLHTQFGGMMDVEVSGSAINQDDKRFYGFSLRQVSRAPARTGGREPLRSANDMAGLVGRVPLREIIRETADIIEQLCIEAALEITNNNRASAAEMLGLSRQSLYSKLRRYRIDGNTADGDDTH